MAIRLVDFDSIEHPSDADPLLVLYHEASNQLALSKEGWEVVLLELPIYVHQNGTIVKEWAFSFEYSSPEWTVIGYFDKV